ncbi:MAG: HEAT repeat domain-containing protein [Candidatus Acidiferrum sp.]
MSGREDSPNLAAGYCLKISPLLVFYVCDELDDAERSAVDAHIAVCPVCAVQLAQERKLHEAVGSATQSADLLDGAGLLLAQCRSELEEKIDDLGAPLRQDRWHPFAWARRWMALRPVWSGALLVIFGVALGTQLLPWIETANDVAGPAVNVLAAPKLTDEQLSKMALSSVRVSPTGDQGGGNIQLLLSAEQPLEISGNVDDHEVRRVLTFAVRNGDRSDVDVRLDCLDALKARVDDEQVRQALLAAARQDQSAAVRMKALESLRGAADDGRVRDTMLQILDHDASPGVRVAAVNLLVRSLQEDIRREAAGGDLLEPREGLGPEAQTASSTGDASGRESASAKSTMEVAIRALADLQLHDPNRDVRVRSAAALRQIAARPQP